MDMLVWVWVSCTHIYIHTHTKKPSNCQCISVYDINWFVTWQYIVGWDRREDTLMRDVQEHRALPTGHGAGLRVLGDTRIQWWLPLRNLRLTYCVCLVTSAHCVFLFWVAVAITIMRVL